MSFTIPNDDGTAQGAIQSEVDTIDLAILAASLSGQTGVISGCAVTPTGTNLQVNVAVGMVRVDGVVAAVTSQNLTCGSADATNPRIDLVQVDNAGTATLKAGTAAAHPKYPTPDSGRAIIAAVIVEANYAAVFASADIVSKRCIVSPWSEIIKPSDTTIDTDATVNADPHLKFPVLASTTYIAELDILYSTGATGDFKFTFTGPSSPTRVTFGNVANIAGATQTNAVNSFTSEISITGTGTLGYFRVYLVVENGANAGTVTFSWAQNSSNGTSTIVQLGSRLRWRTT